MQPVFTQVPPNSFRSITAIFMPASTKRPASDGPACPVPMMILTSTICGMVTILLIAVCYAAGLAVHYRWYTRMAVPSLSFDEPRGDGRWR
jgi:hypothetical protein